MIAFIRDMAVNPFLLTGLLAGALGGLACGAIGPYVVARRLIFLAGALAHVAVGGVGSAIYLSYHFPELLGWLTPLHGAAAASVATAPLLATLRHQGGERLDTAVGALWAGGMALGILLIKLTPGYHAELMGYLFGNLAFVTRADVALLAAVALAVVLVIVTYHRRFLALCVDPEQATLKGISPLSTDVALLVTVALSVTALTRVVGLILVIALISLPAATAGRVTGRIAPAVFLSAGIGLVLTTIPRALAYGSVVSPEAAIVLAAVGVWLIAIVWSWRRRRHARAEVG